MNVIVFINNMFSLANNLLDFVFLWGGFSLFVLYPINFFYSNIKKAVEEHTGRDLILQTTITAAMAMAAAIVWFLPEILWTGYLWYFGLPMTYLNAWEEKSWWISYWRIAAALAFLGVWVRYLGRKHGGNRWWRSLLLVCAIIFFGAILGRWMGILFVSIPLLIVYYFQLGGIARVIVPYSNPEDKAEQRKRVHAFLAYTWGTQAPMLVVGPHAWAKHDARITGDITWRFPDFPIPFFDKLMDRPGLVWTPAHQVVAISSGPAFRRIDGPGVVFTGKLERLYQVFDLRLQMRTKEIDVVSLDGVHFQVRFFTAFRLDNQPWSRDLYHSLLHRNILLHNANNLSHSEGSFPYSDLRIQAALATTGTKLVEGTPLVYWDQWVMNVIEDQTRQVVSQTSLDEMWRPAVDQKFANALDVVATRIREQAEVILRSAGILLVAARVVNFSFSKKDEAKKDIKEGDKKGTTDDELDEISTQQISTWSSEWKRKREAILAQADADAERTQQEARAYAEAQLLNAIAEGLQKTDAVDRENVIAMRFLSALQDYIHKQNLTEKDGEEEAHHLASLQREFKTWQEQFFPDEE